MSAWTRPGPAGQTGRLGAALVDGGGAIWRRPGLAVGCAIILVIVLMALLAPILEHYPPDSARPADSLQPPNAQHWLGTDPSGFDIYSRLLHAARVDLFIGITGTLVAMVLGAIIGLITGYIGGTVDALLGRAVDLLQSFPLFITALLLVSLFGQRVSNIIAAVTFVYLPLYVRTFRTEAATLRDRGFVRSAKLSGASTTYILRRHLLPNALAAALGLWATTIGWAILMAAGLGFIGAGVKPPAAEWGSMISSGTSLVVTGEWWVAVFPGLAIVLTVVGFTLISEGVQDVFDPRSRR